MYHEHGFFAEGLVDGGHNYYDSRRAALEGTARGSTEGNQFDVYTGVGYDAKLRHFTLTPSASLLYSRVGIDGYDEHGSLAPLHIESQEESSLRSNIGVRAAYTANCGSATVTPSLGASWQHEYLENNSGCDARFANGAGSAFTSTVRRSAGTARF